MKNAYIVRNSGGYTRLGAPHLRIRRHWPVLQWNAAQVLIHIRAVIAHAQDLTRDTVAWLRWRKEDDLVYALRREWLKRCKSTAHYALTHQDELTRYGQITMVELPALLDRALLAKKDAEATRELYEKHPDGMNRG